ncbi:uncharacterized protein VTP21DRAFT_4547 [Calcarisporiella thermophila]|uniref:uncharacterized protein n=1 Tax=Calcarisporiella thermophila TaxID=911321 RepID=UPI0037441B47
MADPRNRRSAKLELDPSSLPSPRGSRMERFRLKLAKDSGARGLGNTSGLTPLGKPIRECLGSVHLGMRLSLLNWDAVRSPPLQNSIGLERRHHRGCAMTLQGLFQGEVSRWAIVFGGISGLAALILRVAVFFLLAPIHAGKGRPLPVRRVSFVAVVAACPAWKRREAGPARSKSGRKLGIGNGLVRAPSLLSPHAHGILLGPPERARAFRSMPEPLPVFFRRNRRGPNWGSHEHGGAGIDGRRREEEEAEEGETRGGKTKMHKKNTAIQGGTVGAQLEGAPLAKDGGFGTYLCGASLSPSRLQLSFHVHARPHKWCLLCAFASRVCTQSLSFGVAGAQGFRARAIIGRGAEGRARAKTTKHGRANKMGKTKHANK